MPKIKLCNASEIHPGMHKVVKTEDGKELLIANIKGEFFAINNLCPHMGGPLNEGIMDGCLVSCPWHGWQFDIKTGDCPTNPGEVVSKAPLTVENGEIFTSIPDDWE